MLRIASLPLIIAVFLAGCAVDPTPIDPGCTVASDCPAGQVCTDGRCVMAAGCDDGIRNGDETGVDCGGRCAGCPNDVACDGNGDCLSGACVSGRCAEPACDDGMRNGDESDVDCGGSCEVCDEGFDCGSDDDCVTAICSSGRCVGPTCIDGRIGGDETDIDCGGTCAPCGVGEMCGVGADCAAGVCAGGVCAAPACDDGVQNGTETDQDCGGGCGPCSAGEMCAANGDCESLVCAADRCAAAMCPDGVTNGTETDLDCGGPGCPACADGQTCSAGSDCESQVCTGGACAIAMCPDGVTNGAETDLDCGGPGCPACATGSSCDVGSDCTSGVCDAAVCVGAQCTDGVTNGMETDEDCGGPDCPACADGLMCSSGTDCASGVCSGGVCATAMCPDGVTNGTETDLDCGGPDCPACADGLMCSSGTDCASGVCSGGACATAMCPDGVTNGTETDLDCGGPGCPACADGLMCSSGTDCASGVCSGGACATAMCPDGVTNGTETDLDCGGPGCPGCARGQACSVAGDCATVGCVGSVCVNGPTAGFSLTPTSGTAPLMVSVTSSATAGDGAITTVEYDYGEGGGFETATMHTYASAGTYTVTQRVTDANGFQDTTTAMVDVSAPVFACLLSATDKSPDVDVMLTAEQLAAEWWTLGQSGVRSDCAIAPGSGVYYYEGTIAPYECDRGEAPEGCYATPYELLSFGVGTGTVALDALPGTNAESFGIETGGAIYYDGMYQSNVPRESTETYGFVVDYRGANPIVHLITAEFGTPAVVYSQTLSTVTTELHAMIVGARRKVGVEAQVNFGGDTTNRPFDFDPAAALVAAGLTDEATALTLGFGGSTALPANTRPALSVSADLSVAPGTPVSLSGTATDAEDGDLSAGIYWEDMATVYGSRTSGLGAAFGFTPTQIGLHPVRATIYDNDGGRRQAIVRVMVTGAPTQHDPVQLVNDSLVDPNVGSGIVTDGLSVQWTVADKMGIRANQGLYGQFWYFEATRHTGLVNQGAGLVIWEGDLAPYSADNVPPSMSINTSSGVWQNIIYLSSYDTAESTYGFAVDYRGENPTVYVIIGGAVVAEWVMVDAFVPVHPMLYGNFTAAGLPYDETINFGASAFVQDPCAALATYGLGAVDRAALGLGWGDANTTASCP